MIKILTKKKLIKILKLIVENGYIFEQKCDDFECLDKYVQNEADIAYEIGGIDGLYLAKELREAMRKKV